MYMYRNVTAQCTDTHMYNVCETIVGGKRWERARSGRAPGDGDDDPAGGAEARVGPRVLQSVVEVLYRWVDPHLCQHD